jgi:hypothetical protein
MQAFAINVIGWRGKRRAQIYSGDVPVNIMLNCSQKGEYPLKAEAVAAAVDIHRPIPDDATVKNCIVCHGASGPGKPFKTFIHFVHYESPHLTVTLGEGDSAEEIRGHCWLCHILDKKGNFQLCDLVGG